MDAGAFSNDSVVTEMKDILCLHIDSESESGKPLATQYGVHRVPQLLFLNADSSPRDSVEGDLATAEFLAEVKRVKSGEGTISALRAAIALDSANLEAHFPLISKLKHFNTPQEVEEVCASIRQLVAAGQGYDTTSVDSVHQLYRNLRSIGMGALAEEQVAVMRSLDPTGQSLGLRTLALSALKKKVREPQDLPELLAFLEQETHEKLLFKGWYMVYNVNNAAAKRTRKREVHRRLRAAARNAAVSLWRYTPERHVSNLGNSIAWSYYEEAQWLTSAEKKFALQVARAAMEASGNEVIVIDTYACCLFMCARQSDALAQMERCIELEPENKLWIERRALFLKGKD